MKNWIPSTSKSVDKLHVHDNSTICQRGWRFLQPLENPHPPALRPARSSARHCCREGASRVEPRERGGMLDLLVSPQCRRSRPSAGARTPPPWLPTRHRRSPGTPRLPPLPTQAAPVTARRPACHRPAGPARRRSREVSHSLLATRLMLAQCRSWIGWGDESGWWAYRAGWWEPGWFGLASWWAGWVGWVLGVE